MRLNNRGNLTLISLLVTAAIILVVCAIYFGKSGGVTPTVNSNSKLLDKSTKQTVVGKAMDTGKGVDCRNRLSQIRLGVTTYKSMTGTENNPPSLKEALPNMSPADFRCPVTGQPYVYDPATGQVHCQNPAHANF